MSLQQNINNSIYSLAHLNLLHSVSKDSKEMSQSIKDNSKEISQLIKDMNDGKYAMTPEEIKESEKIFKSSKFKRDRKKLFKEIYDDRKLKENEKLTNEVNRIRKAKPKLTADEAELLARENIAKKQAEYKKSLEKSAKNFAKNPKKFEKNLERARKQGKLGF